MNTISSWTYTCIFWYPCFQISYCLHYSLDCKRINIDKELAPTDDLEKEIITILSHKKIIIVNPNSPIEAFPELEEDPFPIIYYIYYVNYFLNIDFSNNSKEKIISDIINPSEFTKNNSEEAFKIWRDIALSECLEYLNFQMDSVRFDFNPGKKTIAVFNDLLDNFSVSQIYGIIYKAITNATKFCQGSDISKNRQQIQLLVVVKDMWRKHC